MISPGNFIDYLISQGITAFFGVPDSLLAEFCKELDQHPCRHIITANEGNAVATAIGHHLGTGGYAAVYMQNSGLGNALNPLVSLAAPEIYGIGTLLIIGWRGEPGVKDEPQHLLQGQITIALLEAMRIPFAILAPDSNLTEKVSPLLDQLKKGPAAIIVKKDCFAPAAVLTEKAYETDLPTRERTIELLLDHTQSTDLLVSTTGKASRELFELRAKRGESQRDFLTVGGMGHASSIALGLALSRPRNRVFCLDGDGAMLMHLGALATISCTARPENFIYIMLNNGVHESVGGQPTAATGIDTSRLAESMNFKHYFKTDCESAMRKCFSSLNSLAGPVFIEAIIKPGSRKNLGRPTSTPAENKAELMRFIDEQTV
ncbi:MAG: phosphonopyruvate decarboxylase [Candidatus Riflebacteria bacterium]